MIKTLYSTFVVALAVPWTPLRWDLRALLDCGCPAVPFSILKIAKTPYQFSAGASPDFIDSCNYQIQWWRFISAIDGNKVRLAQKTKETEP
ncbi:hypothetical protein [Duganella vulcania]|uniref:Uncharacterized protein n=1 Tax=Duganella vulcania TaxID=2692166 RepID=A0A845GPL8_9BURK|nr:hypothetical protein [Duganella vulcania]MYM95475.1 hypothetical protein [Duganella vulcania]